MAMAFAPFLLQKNLRAKKRGNSKGNPFQLLSVDGRRVSMAKHMSLRRGEQRHWHHPPPFSVKEVCYGHRPSLLQKKKKEREGARRRAEEKTKGRGLGHSDSFPESRGC